MTTPDNSHEIDILMSQIYSVPSDTSHPVQRILFGAKKGSDGIPVPVIERRDANTGILLHSYTLA